MEPTEEIKGLFITSPNFPSLPPLPAEPSGSMTRLTTNMFRVRLQAANYIFVYSVDFRDTIPNDNTVLRKKYIRAMKELMEPIFKKYIFTGTNLFSTYDAGEAEIELPTPELQIKAIFKQAHKISLHDINFSNKDAANAQTCLHFLNIIIKSLLSSLKMIPIGRTGKYLIIKEAELINDYDLSIVPGYITSVRLCDTGVLLELDYTSRILSQKPAYWRMKELRERDPDFQKAIKEEFVGRSVVTWYGNKRIYFIEEVEFELNPSTHKFPTSDGLMSITDYMLKKYKIKIKDVNQPLFVHITRRRNRPEEKVYLVPELCAVAGLSDDMTRNFSAMKRIAVHTKLQPDARMNKIRRLLNLFASKDNTTDEVQPADICRDWKLEIDPNPVQVTGRKAPLTKIRFAGGATQEVEPDGKFKLRGGIIRPLDFDNWFLVCDEQNSGCETDFVNTLYKSAKRYSINIEYPEYLKSEDSRAEGFIKAIRQHIEKKGQPKIVVCILSGSSQNAYQGIKKWSTTNDPPILTQVVKRETLDKKGALLAICDKILLQMNTKMGGELWQLEMIPGVPKKTMVVGIDVSRDKKFACLGVSSSLTPYFSKYYTQVMKISEGKEIAGTIGALVAIGLVKFFEATRGKFYPELVVIYRDGVGESQKGEVFDIEVKGIIEVIKKKVTMNLPQIIFAVVNKKQHTRFFQNSSDSEERYGPPKGKRGYSEAENLLNPIPGTIIHSDIIDSNKYEFLIMPQFVNEGTGTPVRVHAIYNSSSLSLISFEDLTNALCYAYDNWQGPIRTPAPCKYAYSSAKLVSKYTQSKPHNDLLYYKYFL